MRRAGGAFRRTPEGTEPAENEGAGKMKEAAAKYAALALTLLLLPLPLRVRARFVWFLASIKHRVCGSSIYEPYAREGGGDGA